MGGTVNGQHRGAVGMGNTENGQQREAVPSPLTLQDIGDGLQVQLSTFFLQSLLWLMSLIIVGIRELAENEMT